MRIALLTTDLREEQRTYGEPIPRFAPPIEAVLDGLSRLAELELHVISCTQQPMHAPAKLSENTSFHLLNVPKFGWLRTGYQGCVRAIRKKLRTLRPDLVHGQGTERECGLGAAFSGFPNVLTIHGNIGQVAARLHAPIGSFLWCSARLEAFTIPRTGGVFCNSAYTEATVSRYNRRTWYVPNALRREFFDTPIHIAPKIPTLLNIGTVTPYKRQIEILALAERLHRDGYQFKIQFIGRANANRPYARLFLDQIQAAEGRGFAHFLGGKNAKELINSLDTASALIHTPSEEAFGLVVAEALSRNLKLFGTRVGGITDIAASVEGAELFALDDEHLLAEAIGRWLREGSPQPKTAAQEMRLRYHPDVIAKRHLEIYCEVIGARK